MADGNGNGAVGGDTQVTTGGGQQQADFQVPEGKVLLDAGEHKRHTEQLAQFGKLSEYYSRGRKLGIADPKGFDPWQGVTERLGKHKLDVNGLVDMLDRLGGAPQGGGDADSVAAADIDALRQQIKDEVLGEYRKESAREKAMREYEEGTKSEAALLDKQIADLLGPEASDLDKRLWKAAAQEEIWANAQGFDPEHPLAKDGYRRPHDEKSLGSVIEKLKKLRSEAVGTSLDADAKKAQEATKRKPTPPVAGNRGGQGKPESSGSSDMRPGGKPPVAEVEAMHAKLRARRGET